MEVVVFDLETTGLSPYTDEIIQIAGMRMRSGQVLETDFFPLTSNQSGRFSSFISSYTGISNAHVKNAPGAGDTLCEFSDFVGNATLIAHNRQRFDMPFIRETCQREHLLTRNINFVDSINFSRKIWGGRGGHSLDAVMSRLQITENGNRRHDARGDVRILAEAVHLMWSQLCPGYLTWPVPCGRVVLPK